MPNIFVSQKAGGPQDPLAQYIVLAMNMDGNAGDIPTDRNNHTTSTILGSSGRISTANKKFGSGAVDFAGNSGLQIENMVAQDFGFEPGVPFTIECQLFLRAYGESIAGGAMFSSLRGGRTGYSWHVGTDINSCRLTSNVTGGWADNLTVQAGGGPPLNAWTHMVLERDGDKLTIYKNGNVVATRTGTSGWNFLCNVGGMVGCFADLSSVNYFMNGMVDDLVIYKGVAKYKAAFTPPIASQVY